MKFGQAEVLEWDGGGDMYSFCNFPRETVNDPHETLYM